MADRPGTSSAEVEFTAGGTEPPPDPDTVLQHLREQVAGEKAEADALTADVKSLTAAIEALTKNRDDIVKADLAYTKADYPKAVAAVRDYAEEKRPCVEATLGDKLPRAKKLVQDLTAEIDQVGNDLEAAVTALHSAQREADTANGNLTAATKSFTDLLSLPTSLAGSVGALAKLQGELKDAVDGPDAFGAYVIDGEIIRQADALSLPALGAFRGLLIAAWNTMAEAQQKARDAGKKVADRQGDVDRLTLRLTGLTADRVAELRRRWATLPRSAQ